MRVVHYTLKIARLMGITDPNISKVLEYGALLHDIGKIGIPDAILRKPGKLTTDEWVIMKQHPKIGYEILNRIEFLEEASIMVLHHHENFNGNGYPSGLKEEEIPIGSRIFAVADTMDAMTSDRPYRKALPLDAVSSELKNFRASSSIPRLWKRSTPFHSTTGVGCAISWTNRSAVRITFLRGCCIDRRGHLPQDSGNRTCEYRYR